jgi:hypothetical protein
VDEDDLELLYSVIDTAIDEADAWDMALDTNDLTYRLFAAYVTGERDHRKLVEAVLFPPSSSVH